MRFDQAQEFRCSGTRYQLTAARRHLICVGWNHRPWTDQLIDRPGSFLGPGRKCVADVDDGKPGVVLVPNDSRHVRCLTGITRKINRQAIAECIRYPTGSPTS